MKTSATEKAAQDTSADLRALIADAEKLLSSAGADADDKIVELRDRMRSAIDEGRSTYERLRHRVADTASEKVHEADDYVRTHPYHAVGIAAGIGALIGLLVSRRH